MSSDLTFITNEPGTSLRDRFGVLLGEDIAKLVDRILAAKQRDAGADVSALEREIDQLGYALYGLTPAEIKLVEESAQK
jgi:hypothetical protein